LRKNLYLVALIRWEDLGGPFELDHAQLVPIPEVQKSFGVGVFAGPK